MSKKNWFSSIRVKIALAFFFVFTFISAITGLLLYLFIQKNLQKAHLDSMLAEASSILENTSYNPTQIPITNEDQWIYVWYASDDSQIEVYQKNNFPKPQFLLNTLNELDSDSLVSDYNITLIGDTITYASLSRELLGVNDGSLNLILAKKNGDYHAQLQRVGIRLVFANLLAVFLSLGLAYFLSGYSLRPIKEIIAKAKTVRASTNMERLPVGSSGDEVAQLSSTMNAMIERIESSIQDQNRFFASAAHELRTPLANMQSELEYRISASDDSNTSLHSLRDEVIRLKNVVQDFLLVSQLKSDNLELRKVPLRPDDLLYDVLEKLRPTLKKASFEIQLKLEDEIPKISMDSDKMESLLVNLIDNSQKYGDNSSPITVSIDKIGEGFCLKIQNLIGDHDVVKGNGLGLWICKRIATLHEFQFEAREENQQFVALLSFPINAHS